MGIPSVDRSPPYAGSPAVAAPAYTVSQMAAESGHSVLTVADVLAIELLRDADVSVAAAGHRLGNRVEWVHVFETPAVTGMLRGGEFLLTTGIALAAMTPAEGEALAAAAPGAGAAGAAFDPSDAPAGALAPACRSHDLPLLVFGSPVRFVDITHVLNERLVSGELATLRRGGSPRGQLRGAGPGGRGPGGPGGGPGGGGGGPGALRGARPRPAPR